MISLSLLASLRPILFDLVLPEEAIEPRLHDLLSLVASWEPSSIL